MTFLSDKQTTDELNLLGRYQPDAVYHLFNKVRTRGGEQLLDDLFRHPLTDAGAINERTAIFQHFQQAGHVFPLDGQLVEAFTAWIDSGTNRTWTGTTLSTIKKKWLSTLVHDERHAQTEKGIRAAATVLTAMDAFTSSMSLTRLSGDLAGRLEKVRTTLKDKRLKKLHLVVDAEKLPLKDTAYYSHLFKSALAAEMQAMLDFLYETDVYIAVSAVASDKKFGYAAAVAGGSSSFDSSNVFRATDLKHPCLPSAVGNTLSLDSNSNVLFLTGANMAGKSTLMKSIGINLYLAHMGFPVAVEEMQFSVKDGLYSSINVADNISQGYSHFYAEVLRVKRAAELVAEGKNMLVMFDELFKGTNVKDAYEGTLETIKAFAKHHNCLFIVSTHIIEVGEMLESLPNVLFGYMPTLMEGSRPVYTYQLKEGITEDRQGMLIIRNENILELLNE